MYILRRVVQKLLKISEMLCFSRAFCHTFARRFCCEMYDISQIYFAFFLYFDNFKQLLFSQIPAMHTLMLCEDIGREMKF